MEKNHMKKPMVAAAGLMGLTTLVHLFAGGPENYGPLRESALGDVSRSTLSVVWHMVSLVLLLQTLALGELSRRPNPPLWWLTLAGMLGFAALFVGYTLADFGALFALPQWTVFLATAALMIWGRP